MRPVILLDTGPLVAFLNRTDGFHSWAVAQFERIHDPMLTCEAVLSEAQFQANERRQKRRSVLRFVSRGIVKIQFHLAEEINEVQQILEKYGKDHEVDLADACLVRMSEQHPDSVVFTIDSQFSRIYRRHGDQPLPLIIPDDRR